jgi:4-alpha-glucanotransferase
MQTPPGKRAAGVLLHITSLPSPFGIGDLGPEALAFAEFLHRSRQHYWQILPLTPVHGRQGFSPYSSVSGMAGNPLLISPELLVQDGLLTAEELLPFRLPVTGKVQFENAHEVKHKLFEKAYQRFLLQPQEEFESFCNREAPWLDDFALYMALKVRFDDQPWYAWPDEFKHRRLRSLMDFTAANTAEMNRTRWLQFIFFRQWKALKNYCNRLHISMLGDLPFYMSHDSADVWAQPDIFNLKKDGSMAGVAGVPPDYFNEDGQRWGMPVYRWDVLAGQRFDWWIRRIRKNLELTDLLRLDHFRAFAEYWEVPAREKTAVSGKWLPGPGAAFFKVLQQEFGRLPLVAEDLGDIGDDVYRLRDQFALPGMKVLQFAFGENMPESDHIPHNFSENFVAYTGTHDNNTTLGWFRRELKEKDRRQIGLYAGQPVTEKNINHILGRMAYASVAATVILPLQDVLGLDEKARMNTPASTAGNWAWRLLPNQLLQHEEDLLREWATIYNRSGIQNKAGTGTHT